MHYADGSSGVDLASLRVRFDQPVGSRAAGADLSGLFHRRDDGAFIAALAPPDALPTGVVATLTVELADLAGNRSSETVTFFAGVAAPVLPVAVMDAAATGDVLQPLAFSADRSSDGDGKLVRWEWYFSDASTALGRNVVKSFATAGSHDVMLLVRDNEGGVATTSSTVTIAAACAQVPGPVADVTLVAAAGTAVARWSPEPVAGSYRVYAVTRKDLIPTAHAPLTPACDVTATSCDLGPVAGPDPVAFYQAIAVCAGDPSVEGPH